MRLALGKAHTAYARLIVRGYRKFTPHIMGSHTHAFLRPPVCACCGRVASAGAMLLRPFHADAARRGAQRLNSEDWMRVLERRTREKIAL